MWAFIGTHRARALDDDKGVRILAFKIVFNILSVFFHQKIKKKKIPKHLSVLLIVGNDQQWLARSISAEVCVICVVQ